MPRFALIFLALWISSAIAGDRVPLPALHAAYAHIYEGALKKYAKMQGYLEPGEMAGTVDHELIHIAQAHKLGYYLPDDVADGAKFQDSFVGPYLTDPVWQQFLLPTNEQVMNLMRPPGPMDQFIPRNYGGMTPQNTLLNVVDEINAYRLTGPWICKKSPTQCGKQTRNLSGQLEFAAWHLYYLRTKIPAAGMRFGESGEAKLVFTIIGLGIKALHEMHGSAPLMEKEGALWN